MPGQEPDTPSERETYPRRERLNKHNECQECTDAAEGSWGF